jgi:hypothetical protein
MSVRNAIVLLLALSTLSLLVGCGSSSPQAVPPPSGSFGNGNLKGTYVFSVSGIDANGFAYAVLGTVNADGNGGIGGGTIDINDSDGFPPAVVGVTINNTGTYGVGVDGRGQMTIGTATANPFSNITNGDMTFDFVLADSSHGLITQFDDNASGSGTIDLQATGLTQSSLTGPYAFSLSGVDPSGTGTFATVGNFTLAADGTITPSGLQDFNDNGFLSYQAEPLGGQVILGPNTSSTLSTSPYTGNYDVYAIDPTHLKFIETDTLPVLSGDAYSQTSTAMPTGPLAFTMTGLLTGNPFAAGGFMVAGAATGGVGSITSASTEDFNANGTPDSSPSFSAVYTANGTGRFTLGTFTDFVGGGTYAAYPYASSSAGQGLLLLEIDTLGITSGAAYPQSTTSFGTTAQGFGLNLSGDNIAQGGFEVDDIAEFSTSVAVSGNGTLTSGLIDENVDPGGVSNFGAPFYKLALTDGTYGPIDTTGRYGLSATAGNSTESTLNGGFGLTFYTVDGTTFPFIETDSNGQVATGVFVVQNSAASSSAAARPHLFVPQSLVRPRAARKQKKN